MFAGWLDKLLAASKTKISFMRKSAIKDQLYGSILEMIKNREYFYQSSVGGKHQYSHWTEEGHQALIDFLENHAKLMLVTEEEIVRNQAKQMTFDALKTKET